ncbi:MAG: helix-turn-helix transcriptional regulator [Acidobacteria bacterium]|nr:helix-turn-helix transcriptional regulator [Acidobacteriota bacterium]
MKATAAVPLDEILKAAGEPTRLRLLNLLRLGSICVCDLQAVLGIPQPTVSRHLAALRHAGLVLDSRNGTRMIYSLAPPDNPQIIALYQLLAQCCPNDEVMQADVARLKEALEQGSCRVEAYGPNHSARKEE